MTDKIKGGGFGIRALSGYDAEDARFEVDVDYMRELPKHPGHPMDPAKVKPGLVCKCWATNADDFYPTKVSASPRRASFSSGRALFLCTLFIPHPPRCSK